MTESDVAPDDERSFYAALRTGDATSMRQLIAAQPRLTATRDADGATPALAAMYAGHLQLADELAAGQAMLSVFEAAAFDDTTRLGELADADESLLEAWSPDGWQPLHLAAMFGRAEAARLLLDADAPVDETSRNARACEPLTLAAAGGHTELVWILIASSAYPDSRDADGRTPLMAAAASGDPESVRALLAAGADLAATDETGTTAAGFAASDDVRRLLS